MKIITRCVIDLELMQVIEEQWFDYCGPLAQCKGGGTSGTVDYPTYMKTVHNLWLDHTGVDSLDLSITDVMDAALASSPYVSLEAFNPDTTLTESAAAITAFVSILSGVVDTTGWAALFTQAKASIGDPLTDAISEAIIAADITAFSDQLTDEMNTKTLPRFRRGMQDINAVVSSAFPIGEAVIEAFRGRDVAKYSSILRLEVAKTNAEIRVRSDSDYKRMYVEASNQMLHLMLQRISWQEGVVRTTIESNRIKIVAKKEQADVNAEIDVHDALWDIELFQHGANLLGAIGGGTSGVNKPSRAQSAIGGALSGAAAGAMTGAQIGAAGGPIGAVGGAVIGGIAGIASAFL